VQSSSVHFQFFAQVTPVLLSPGSAIAVMSMKYYCLNTLPVVALLSSLPVVVAPAIGSGKDQKPMSPAGKTAAYVLIALILSCCGICACIKGYLLWRASQLWRNGTSIRTRGILVDPDSDAEETGEGVADETDSEDEERPCC
jgi:hypothetical protein